MLMFQFKDYAKQPFHIAGESYAGTYIPNIASVIHQHNLALSLDAAPGMYKDISKINLESLLIGNGLTNPYEQFGSVAE